MTAFTALHALVPVLAGIGAICLLSWAAVAVLVWRETRNRREDREDTAINHGIPAAVPLPAPDANDEEFEAWGRAFGIVPDDPTPLFTAVCADRLQRELNNDAA